MRRLVEVAAFVIASIFLIAVFLPEVLIAIPGTPGTASDVVANDRAAASNAGNRSLRRHVLAHGEEETGAENLVTAIYLGYRAFDTFGETVVLLLAVSGVLFLVKGKA